MNDNQEKELIHSPEDAEKAAYEEKERREVLEASLEIAATKIRNRLKLPLHEMVVAATEDLPEELKNRVMRSFEPIREFCEEFQRSSVTEEELQKLKECNVPEEMINSIRGRQISQEKIDEFLKKQVDRISVEVENSFVADMGKNEEGKEIRMPNKNFSRLQIQQEINRVLEKDHSPEALKGIARISIDLNNLKKANDYNGSHEKGDAYLRLVESILNSPTKPTLKEFAEKRNINIVGVARVGGDEFDVINTIKELNDSKGYVEFGEGINQLQEEIKRRLAEKKDAANIVNFKEEKVLLHYAGITGGEEEAFYKKSEEERNTIIEEIKKEIPPDFEFIATVSCGAATLYDAMMDKENDKDGENKIKHDDDYGRILKKMMGCLFNTSDARMQKNKEKYKQLLAIGNDHERMMYRISTRNIEELKRVKLAQKKDDKIRILNALNNMQKELGGLVAVGSSESTLEGKRAEIAVAEQESKRIDEDLKKME